MDSAEQNENNMREYVEFIEAEGHYYTKEELETLTRTSLKSRWVVTVQLSDGTLETLKWHPSKRAAKKYAVDWLMDFENIEVSHIKEVPAWLVNMTDDYEPQEIILKGE